MDSRTGPGQCSGPGIKACTHKEGRTNQAPGPCILVSMNELAGKEAGDPDRCDEQERSFEHEGSALPIWHAARPACTNGNEENHHQEGQVASARKDASSKATGNKNVRPSSVLVRAIIIDLGSAGG